MKLYKNRCAVCKEIFGISLAKGCRTDIGFVCKKCIRNWLADYLQMVNPFLHLKGEETFKLRRNE
tara:strand:+ start:857 stop:1051 length:195 start_codon:yes stop_codon:yes gene_type:complete